MDPRVGIVDAIAPLVQRAAPAEWPALAPFIHRHNRRADGGERCLHAHQGDTVAQLEHELAALPPDEAAFWQLRDADGATAALVGCEFDPALGRAWLRGPLCAGEASQHGPRLLQVLEEALQRSPGIRCFDAFPAEAEVALNALYAERGYRRLGVHRVLEAALAPVAAAPPWPLLSGVSLGPATAAQLPALLVLHESLFPSSYLKPSDFADALADPARLVLACTAGDGRLLGYLAAKDDPEQPEVYIDYLGTAPEARGQGLGHALLAGALDWGRALGRPRASLTVREDRAPALALYERSGFRQVSAGVHWRHEVPETPGVHPAAG